jgi:predicted transcriptional regulator
MTVREELHRIVDELPDEELIELRQIVNELKTGTEGEEAVSAESLAAIQEGLEDIKAGRTVSWERVKDENRL